VTDRKLAEEVLKESEGRFREFFENHSIIANNHRGSIFVDSPFEDGTVFTISLPFESQKSKPSVLLEDYAV
jgi:hypothetical protein